jgi:hypothetical protein
VDWDLIASQLGTRNGAQCMEQWYSRGPSMVARGEWQPREDKLLVRALLEGGAQEERDAAWARAVPGRSEAQVGGWGGRGVGGGGAGGVRGGRIGRPWRLGRAGRARTRRGVADSEVQNRLLGVLAILDFELTGPLRARAVPPTRNLCAQSQKRWRLMLKAMPAECRGSFRSALLEAARRIWGDRVGGAGAGGEAGGEAGGHAGA